MLGCFEKVAAKDINARYFLLDTTSVYILE
jgi:hypothetical protein